MSMFSRNDNNRMSLDMFCGDLEADAMFKEIAIKSAINLIANTIAKAEFLTFRDGQEIKEENYYRLNVEPNQNKAAPKFWRSVITKLLLDNECLVLLQDGMYYIADDFEVVNSVFKENTYQNIVIDNYEIRRIYKESEVFHFENQDADIKSVIDNLYSVYGKLIKTSTDNYKKNNARRGTIKVPTSYPQTEKAQQDLEDLLKNKFKRFFEAEGGAVLPLTNKLEYEELISNIGAKSSAVEGRDTRAFIDDVFDFVAIGFGISPNLLKGNTVDTEDAVNNLLTFCISPLAKNIDSEVNRKLYRKDLFLNNTYCKLDTSRIKTVDVKDIANALDVLLRTGSYTINDCLRDLGKEQISEELGDQRFMTKNYAAVEEILKGGE